ncbi:hypothetical protein NLM31_12740 [Bradyrhizobium sp. CCGUVB4N]|uniref:hypothetical protein n=1 Tax=Bradyrhizobium sp. CCGUVB4N TaxID=2949631 RepID=UPI0020B38056|nr:hypothetical protein [Bradyrhizobium sp. CCGUVB4N]MCP3381207.1 hypothetical protein [Bradyrhizobium sp. CCGUVB4N]
MENQEIELFVHASGRKPQVVLAAAEETLGDTLRRLDLLPAGDHGHHIFVGEAVTETIEIEHGAQEHTTVDIDLKLVVLDLHKHRHVHVHKCQRIAVAVNFSADTKDHKFKPNTTIGTVTDWARKQFPIDAAVAGEYVLQIHGTTTQPRSTEHLGDVVEGDTCSICFDLVKEVTPKG